MALIILNSGGGGGGGGGLANIPVTNADGSVTVPATSLKFNNSLVVANGNQAIITPNGSGGGSNTIIGIIDPTNTTQASAVGQLYYNSTTLQTFICIAIVSGVPATYTWNLITGITINIVAPTTTTPGFVGQLYVYNNNSVFSYYICVSNANNTYTWKVLTGGGTGGGINVNKGDGSGTNVVPNATTLNFAGVGYSVVRDLNILNQANVIANPTNNANFSYIYKSDSDTFPFTFTFTDLTLPVPTGWTWTISANGIGSFDYSFINGTSATSQNPQILFFTANLYNVTLTPTNTDRTIRYTAFSSIIPPNVSSAYIGSFTVSCRFGNDVANKTWFNYSATDVFSIAGEINDIDRPITQVNNTFTQINASNDSPVPTFTITVNDINRGFSVTSTPIPQPIFPVYYYAQISATITNVDTALSDKIITSNNVSYYIPAFYIINQSLTAPTFDITASQVEQDNYLSGQSILFAGSDFPQNSQIIIWVAFPKIFPIATPAIAYISFDKFFNNTFSGFADRVSDTAVIQVINGITFSIFGYQIGYTSNQTLFGSLFLESFIIAGPDTNIILPTKVNATPKTGALQAKIPETPKLGFFQRLFGAKS